MHIQIQWIKKYVHMNRAIECGFIRMPVHLVSAYDIRCYVNHIKKKKTNEMHRIMKEEK